ncbi:MAG: hypothetical protein ABI864_03005 [Chloroflexota bacterium]
MNDDQLTRLLRQVDEPVSPDPVFADRLFEQLVRTTVRSRGARTGLPLVAALVLLGTIAAGLAVGSGVVKLPWLAVDVTPSLSGLPMASLGVTPSAQPSAPTPPIASTAVFDLLPVPQPSGYVSKISCDGPIGTSDPVAVVQLHGVGATGEQVLLDVADPGSPRIACTFGDAHAFVRTLIDARHVVIQNPGADLYTYAVVDLPEVRYHWFQLPGNDATYPTYIAVGPGLDQVLWMSADQAGGSDKIHLTTQAGDAIVATLPNPQSGRDCIPEEESKLGAYAHSGADFFVLDQPVPNLNSLLLASAKTALLQVLPPTGGWSQGAQPAMALWSPTSEALYYRQGSDVWTWEPDSSPKRFLPGVSWLHPTISPDGTHLAYAVARRDGLHEVYLVDLAQGGSPQLIGNGARTQPVFLNSTQLWYATDTAAGCPGPSSNPLVYSFVDGSESSSVIDLVYGVWPTTSSNW